MTCSTLEKSNYGRYIAMKEYARAEGVSAKLGVAL
jgi:hypothetical protein